MFLNITNIMEHYEIVKKVFNDNKGIHMSRRRLAKKLGLTKPQMVHALWMLKEEGLVRESKPCEVGSMKKNVAVCVSV